MPDFLALSENSKQAILIAQNIAKEYQNSSYSTPHLLKALLHDDIGVIDLLNRLEKDINYLNDIFSVNFPLFLVLSGIDVTRDTCYSLLTNLTLCFHINLRGF